VNGFFLAIESCIAIFIGIAGGIAVGSGMVAFLVMLDIIPRLAQITRSHSYVRVYEAAIVFGSLVFTIMDFWNVRLTIWPVLTAVIGLFAGGFIGLLAAALTEVVNVIPILAKRIGIGGYMVGLLTAMVLGKVLGSLFEWLFF
jgi:stage V sporulation protein AB